MNHEIEDGGSAFPQINVTERGLCVPRGGMSLRDYFAARAMNALIMDRLVFSEENKGFNPSEIIARNSYTVADAMIKAREVK